MASREEQAPWSRLQTMTAWMEAGKSPWTQGEEAQLREHRCRRVTDGSGVGGAEAQIRAPARRGREQQKEQGSGVPSSVQC